MADTPDSVRLAREAAAKRVSASDELAEFTADSKKLSSVFAGATARVDASADIARLRAREAEPLPPLKTSATVFPAAPGGDTSLVDEGPNRGVWAKYPASTPKFHPGNKTEARRTHARLYIEFPNRAAILRLMKSGTLSDQAVRLLSALGIYAEDSGTKKTSNNFSNYRARGGTGYFDFFLTGFSLQQSEQHQVSEVLSDAYVAYYFGQNAPRGQLSGVVLNTRQDNWFDAWYIIYQELLRGTKLATFKSQAVLKVDTRLYFGSMYNVSTQLGSQFETMASFSMGMLVKRIHVLHGRRSMHIASNPVTLDEANRFVAREKRKNSAVTVKAEKDEAIEQDKKVEVKESRNVIYGPPAPGAPGGVSRNAAVDAEGEAVSADSVPYGEAPVSGPDAYDGRFYSTPANPEDLQSINDESPEVGDPGLQTQSFGPTGTEVRSTEAGDVSF